MSKRLFACLLFLVAIILSITGISQDRPLTTTFNDQLVDHPAIRYATAPTTDPVAQLNRKIESGQVVLKAEGESGYLRSLLDALDVPFSSQVVVFAKDSVQAKRINPRNPRTIFFNDSVAVGWVRGGFIELASQDPQQGTIFYTMDAAAGQQKPTATRTDSCAIACHENYATAGVPGMLVRSSAQFSVDHSIPLAERWGGWYVTGRLGSIQHMGNIEPDKLFGSSRPKPLSLQSLEEKFDMNAYLEPSSDVAALMVFDHQMRLINLLTRINWEVRTGDYQPQWLQDAATEVAEYMLFVDEAPIPNRIEGSTRFAAAFAARGPRDDKGRSLRQLSLDGRLMQYPCSYMIYSAQFDSLSEKAKAAIYDRMWNILSGQNKGPKYSRLSLADRRVIVEILKSTKKDVPDYFQIAALK